MWEKQHAFCSYCGASRRADMPFPYTCYRCSNTTWINPVPVSVVLIPVGDGFVTVRRAIAPAIGELALPGGFVNEGEAWQFAGVREVREEACIDIDPRHLQLLEIISPLAVNVMLIFSRFVPGFADESELPPFVPNEEASERVIVTSPVTLAFPAHSMILGHALTDRANQNRAS